MVTSPSQGWLKHLRKCRDGQMAISCRHLQACYTAHNRILERLPAVGVKAGMAPRGKFDQMRVLCDT